MLELITANPLIASLLALSGLALVIGALLGFAQVQFHIEGDPLVEKIDQLLPQTQCGQCGHPGCRPYAEAIASGEAINKCPPGGDSTIQDLADLLGREPLPLDAEEGVTSEKKVAFIREAECIGCTKCIQACPVDAIIGAPKVMHTIIIDECTGCDLCVEPCPVDCIDMLPLADETLHWHWPAPPGPLASPEARLIATDRQPKMQEETSA